ncbi:MAG: hypothetical protein EPO68_16340 [Planctomycetota bacterium]|nr:MAG: hypothetical protein EPO68_16340 [Planctomycetota bacterium]
MPVRIPAAISRPSAFALPVALFGPVLALLAGSPRAQSVDVAPAYHPEGPAAQYAEVYFGDPVTFELALPGLTHAQSQAQASSWLSLAALSSAKLAAPIPLGPNAALWLDPAKLVLSGVPPSLELKGVFQPFAGAPQIDVYAQGVHLRLSDQKLYTSPPLHVRALAAPSAGGADVMRPRGALAGGATAVWYDAPTNEYRLRWDAPGGADWLEYVLDLDHGGFAKGTLRVFEKHSGLQVLQAGGVFYAQGFGVNLWSPQQFETNAQHVLEAHGVTGKTAWFHWRDEAPKLGGGTSVHRRRHEFTLHGRALEVNVRGLDASGGSAADNYYAWRLGNVSAQQGQPAPTFKPVHVAYMDQIGITLVANDWFHSGFVDLFRSNSAQHAPAQFSVLGNAASYTELMQYTRASDATISLLGESGWVGVSREISDLFVETSAPPSPRASQLSRKIGVTFSGSPEQGISYAEESAKIAQLRSFGFDDVYLFKFNWMRFGTNRRATTHVPPMPQGGTVGEFTTLVQDAVAAGWRIALYTDLFSLDQAQGLDDNPNYSENSLHYENFEDGLKLNDLTYRKGFGMLVNPSIPNSPSYFSRILAPRRALKHWEREAKTFVDVYGSNAAYFDVNCISAPDLIVTASGDNVGGALNQDARSPSDRTLRGAIRSYKSLYQHAGERSGGATVGEGSFVGFDARFDTFYAGYLDGTYRTLSTGGPPTNPATSGQIQPVVPDYELQCVRGKHYGFGLGQPQRFFTTGFTVPLIDPLLAEYRATQISYAHNGYLISNAQLTEGGEYVTIPEQVKEYYLFRSLQNEWANGQIASVRYRAGAPGSPWLTLSQALKSGLDLVHPVIKQEWTNGLVVIVNHAQSNVVELGITLPTHGWIALNPNTGYINLAALVPATGKLGHLVFAPNYMLADGNGTAFTCNGVIGQTTLLKVVRYDTGLKLTEQHDGTMLIR